MKSKIISLMLAGSMLLSLGACAKKDPTDGSSDTSVTTETTAKKETTETMEPSLETTPTPTVPSETETEPTEAPTYGPQEYSFTKINYPVIDGSTSTKPMAAALTSIMLGIPRSETDEMLKFHKTSSSFSYLVEGTADLLICAEPADSVFDMMKENHFDYEMEPFAAEALVFVVNASNPVDSLTIEQIQKIYTGEIKNWKEVGGEDKEIVPVQRNETAGSQVMMEKLVMKDLTMMDAPKELMPEEMGGLIKVVKSYDNSAGAIGYTPYYYATNMKMADGLKIIKVGGVEPNKETIAKGEYPFRTSYYVVISKMIPEGWAPRVLYNWILSEEGQKLAELEGYVPAAEKKDVETVVYANWDIYQPSNTADPVYKRLKKGDMDDFTPSSQYGRVFLLPCIYRNTGDEESTGITYGIFDKNGTLLCDPVFDNAFEYMDDMYVVEKYGPEEDDESYGLLSADGAFYTGVKYDGFRYLPDTDNYLLYIDKRTHIEIYFCDKTKGVSEDPIKVDLATVQGDYYYVPLVFDVIGDRYIIIACDGMSDGCLYDRETGKAQTIPDFWSNQYRTICGETMVLYDWEKEYYYCQDLFGKKLSEKEYEEYEVLSDGSVLLKRKDWTGWDILNAEGKIRTALEKEPTEYISLQVIPDGIILYHSDRIELLDMEFHTVSSVNVEHASNYSYVYEHGAIVSCKLDEKTILINLKNGKKLELSGTWWMDAYPEYVVAKEYEGYAYKGQWKILDPHDLKTLYTGQGDIEMIEDTKDHKYYLAFSSSESEDDISVMDLSSGKVVFKDLPNPRMDKVEIQRIYDGKLIYNTNARSGYYSSHITSTTMIDQKGNILFLYNTLCLPED
ncbi:MAG: substrate-binding domain-containing protein [Clostridiales bacterium]|nr:substrate-binding domain-containing protein [Clostridiales bacterium]